MRPNRQEQSVTNQIALILGILILVLIGGDLLLADGTNLVFLSKKDGILEVARVALFCDHLLTFWEK